MLRVIPSVCSSHFPRAMIQKVFDQRRNVFSSLSQGGGKPHPDWGISWWTSSQTSWCHRRDQFRGEMIVNIAKRLAFWRVLLAPGKLGTV